MTELCFCTYEMNQSSICFKFRNAKRHDKLIDKLWTRSCFQCLIILKHSRLFFFKFLSKHLFLFMIMFLSISKFITTGCLWFWMSNLMRALSLCVLPLRCFTVFGSSSWLRQCTSWEPGEADSTIHTPQHRPELSLPILLLLTSSYDGSIFDHACKICISRLSYWGNARGSVHQWLILLSLMSETGFVSLPFCPLELKKEVIYTFVCLSDCN